MIPTINKLTRVTRHSVAAIDHILTNFFANLHFKTKKFNSNIYHHFPISFFFLPMTNKFSKTKLICVEKIEINNNNTLEMSR